mmetsp:Transcript_90489/g.234639  ORF Transcript_90489/g.234639 Transcript_90489/m.234639 type:complete len:225 (+) Transcript_90489:845-1519(+)
MASANTSTNTCSRTGSITNTFASTGSDTSANADASTSTCTVSRSNIGAGIYSRTRAATDTNVCADSGTDASLALHAAEGINTRTSAGANSLGNFDTIKSGSIRRFAAGTNYIKVTRLHSKHGGASAASEPGTNIHILHVQSPERHELPTREPEHGEFGRCDVVPAQRDRQQPLRAPLRQDPHPALQGVHEGPTAADRRGHELRCEVRLRRRLLLGALELPQGVR